MMSRKLWLSGMMVGVGAAGALTLVAIKKLEERREKRLSPFGARPQVVIVGAGFGGLWAAKAFSGKAVDVYLLDRNNYHTFIPLLYQVAACELEPPSITNPVRSIVQEDANVTFVLAEVKRIDLPGRKIEATDGAVIPYDYLILATGSTSHFFGIPGASDHSLPLRSLEDASQMRNRMLLCFELGIREYDLAERKRLLTFVIVGGGPSGVEYAGALAELIRGPLSKDFRDLDLQHVRVILLEATDALLGYMPRPLQDYARQRLEEIGVEVRLKAAVNRVTEQGVHLQEGEFVPAATVIWTAGVRGATLASSGGLPLARNGTIRVQPTLQVEGHSHIYAVGDLARLEENGKPLPMLAPVASQEGEWAAKNILRQIDGQDPLAFQYHDRGTMATIGRGAAVAAVGDRSFTDFFAWVLWLVVHIFNLIGFRNRLLVMINWCWDYFFHVRAVRLIFPQTTVPGYTPGYFTPPQPAAVPEKLDGKVRSAEARPESALAPGSQFPA